MADCADAEQSRHPFTDRSLAHAIGGAICVIGAILQREGIVDLDDLSDFMALFATVSAESDEDAGLLLAHWASMLKSFERPGASER